MNKDLQEILYRMNLEEFRWSFNVLSGFNSFKDAWRNHELYGKLRYLLENEPVETSRGLYFMADWMNRYPFHSRGYRHEYDNPIACILISLQDAPAHEAHALHLQLISSDVMRGNFHWSRKAVEKAAWTVQS